MSLPDNSVNVQAETTYPFSDTLVYTVTATKAFTFAIRIPSWSVNGSVTSVGGSSALAPIDGLHSIAIPSGTTVFQLNLPAEIIVGK